MCVIWSRRSIELTLMNSFLAAEFLYLGVTGFAGDLPILPTGLVEVDFAFCLIDGGLSDAVFAPAAGLEYVNLGGNAFNATVPMVFGTLAQLEFFYISDCFISGDLSYMQGMPKIFEHWNDVNPGLGGPIFDFIGNLATLQSFSVTQSSLTGTLPTSLGLLADMQQMWYYANLLTGPIPTELGNLRRMGTLQLEGNSFTGAMPDSVCANTGFLGVLDVLGVDCAEVTVRNILHAPSIFPYLLDRDSHSFVYLYCFTSALAARAAVFKNATPVSSKERFRNSYIRFCLFPADRYLPTLRATICHEPHLLLPHSWLCFSETSPKYNIGRMNEYMLNCCLFHYFVNFFRAKRNFLGGEMGPGFCKYSYNMS